MEQSQCVVVCVVVVGVLVRARRVLVIRHLNLLPSCLNSQ